MKKLILLVLIVLSYKSWSQSPSCNNLDFESGNFSNWDTNDDIVSITSGTGTDPYGGFPVVAPGGNYSAKLGDTSRTGDRTDRLDYTMTVTPENTFFAYRFAFVMEHPPATFTQDFDRPVLRFRMYWDIEAGYVECGSEEFIVGDTPGLMKVPSQDIYYLPWTTYFVDLSEHVGKSIKIVVEVLNGKHVDLANENYRYLFAYAYFDAYCSLPISVSGKQCKDSPLQFSVAFDNAFPNSTYTWKMGDGTTYNSKNVNHTFSTPGTKTITLTYYPMPIESESFCGGQVFTTSINISDCGSPFVCEDCIPSFSPLPGEKYLLVAWVKQGEGIGKSNYTYPGISVNFNTGSSIGPFKPSGLIIDGWQRIEGEFTVPNAAKEIWVELHNDNNSEEVYFDDIRIQPFNASMKSFVFDPVSLRLVSELDERNYATFYEYDEEGKLTRVKKETEKGVKTIRETRESIRKIEQ